jgi:hypothetical protein
LSLRDVGVNGKFLLCAKILTGYEESGMRSQVQRSGFPDVIGFQGCFLLLTFTNPEPCARAGFR